MAPIILLKSQPQRITYLLVLFGVRFNGIISFKPHFASISTKVCGLSRVPASPTSNQWDKRKEQLTTRHSIRHAYRFYLFKSIYKDVNCNLWVFMDSERDKSRGRIFFSRAIIRAIKNCKCGGLRWWSRNNLQNFLMLQSYEKFR